MDVQTCFFLQLCQHYERLIKVQYPYHLITPYIASVRFRHTIGTDPPFHVTFVLLMSFDLDLLSFSLCLLLHLHYIFACRCYFSSPPPPTVFRHCDLFLLH